LRIQPQGGLPGRGRAAEPHSVRVGARGLSRPHRSRTKGDVVMNTWKIWALAVTGSVFAAGCLWGTVALAQNPPGGFPNVLAALKAAPGCLGVETGQTASGRRVIFAWFESKKTLVDWYHSDAHQKAMKSVFPNQAFDRQ